MQVVAASSQLLTRPAVSLPQNLELWDQPKQGVQFHSAVQYPRETKT